RALHRAEDQHARRQILARPASPVTVAVTVRFVTARVMAPRSVTARALVVYGLRVATEVPLPLRRGGAGPAREAATARVVLVLSRLVGLVRLRLRPRISRLLVRRPRRGPLRRGLLFRARVQEPLERRPIVVRRRVGRRRGRVARPSRLPV